MKKKYGVKIVEFKGIIDNERPRHRGSGDINYRVKERKTKRRLTGLPTERPCIPTGLL
jgi:hypothetical protein